jgi:hypothetical protein
MEEWRNGGGSEAEKREENRAGEITYIQGGGVPIYIIQE